MNIDNFTIGEAKALAAMFGGENQKSTQTPHIGNKCIIRTYASGVHFGVVVDHNGRQVELKDARRLWKWHATKGISLSDVAMNGIDPSKSRICCTVPQMTILDALEIIPASDVAAGLIEGAPVASK